MQYLSKLLYCVFTTMLALISINIVKDKFDEHNVNNVKSCSDEKRESKYYLDENSSDKVKDTFSKMCIEESNSQDCSIICKNNGDVNPFLYINQDESDSQDYSAGYENVESLNPHIDMEEEIDYQSYSDIYENNVNSYSYYYSYSYIEGSDLRNILANSENNMEESEYQIDSMQDNAHFNIQGDTTQNYSIQSTGYDYSSQYLNNSFSDMNSVPHSVVQVFN